MSATYREFTGLNLPAFEQEILAQWTDGQAFEKSVSLREGATPFVFYEGPPSANGMPGIHHVISRTLKDLVCRYKTMKGFQVKRKGGWDTHVAQGTTSGWLASLLEDVASSLHAFASDIGPTMKRVTVVVQTEFGRRAYENSALGTDHGRASCLFVLGGGTRGGRVYGDWPGLADEKLEEGDLRVTTDYRQILAEVLEKRLHNAATERVFPGLSAQPLGIVA